MGDDQETAQQKLRKTTINLLRSVLASKAKIGVPLHILPHEFEEVCFETLKFREMGYGSLEQFLRDIPDVCTVSRAPEGFFVVKGVASKEDAHIYKLVSGQKKKSKKKKRQILPSKFSSMQVKRRASHFSSGRRPNIRPQAYDNSAYATGRSHTSVPSAFSRTATTFIRTRNGGVGQVPTSTQNWNKPSHPLPSSSKPSYNSSYQPKAQSFFTLPPRFQRHQSQQSNNQFNNSRNNVSSNEVIVISDDNESNQAYLPGLGKISLNKPSTSTPTEVSFMTPHALAKLEVNIRKLLEFRSNGLWASRLNLEYKNMFNTEPQSDLLLIILQKFSHFVRIESPIPDREILYLKKEDLIEKAPPIQPVKINRNFPNLQITSNQDQRLVQKVPTQPNNVSHDLQNLHITSDQDQRVLQQVSSPITPVRTNGHITTSPTTSPRIELNITSLPLPKSGEERQVLVCHVESLNRFFIQFHDSEIDQLVLQMQSFYDNNTNNPELSIVKPKFGEYCCAQFGSDAQWYRAKVLSVKAQKNQVNESYRCRVLYIDYGNDETVISKELRCLRKEFSELPIQAIQCSLYDVYPLEETRGWSDDVIQYFKEFAEQKYELTLSVQERNGNILTVDLLYDDGKSLCAHLASTGRAKRVINVNRSRSSSSSSDRSESTRVSSSSTLWKSLSLESNEITAQWVKVSDDCEYLDVAVSNINSTTDLSLILIDNANKLDSLESHLTKYYDDDTVPLAGKLIVEKFYAALQDESWYRIQLLCITNGECQVLLVDRGNKAIVSINELKDLLPKYYLLPFQALPCSLDTVPESFDPEILQLLSDSVLGKPTIACIMERPPTSGKKYSIQLYDTSSADGDDRNINDELVAKIDAENNLQPILPEVGGESCQGLIAHLEDSGDFIIQILGPGWESLSILMDDINAHFSQPTRASEILPHPEVGTICCAKFHQDGGWYRAKVIKVMQKERKVEVEFVDYGNREVIQMLLIRKPDAVSEKVRSLPFQAVRCKLESLDKLNFTEEHCTKIKNFVNEYAEVVFVETVNKDHEIPVVKFRIPIENGRSIDFLERYQQHLDEENQNLLDAYNELHSTDQGPRTINQSTVNNTAINNTTFENISILTPHNAKTNTTLSEWDVISSDTSPDRSFSSAEDVEVHRIKSGKNLSNIQEERRETSSDSSSEHTTTESSNSSTRSESPATTFSATWGIPQMEINERVFEAIVQYSIDPYKFSLIPTSKWDQICSMHNDMKSVYKDSRRSSDTFQPGDLCVVFNQDHGLWYRAVIHAKVEEQVVVKCPDFCNELELVSLDKIRPLYEQFKKFPFFGIRCTLADIEPVSGGKSWSNEAAKKFYDTVMNETFQVEVLSTLSRESCMKPLEVRLHGESTTCKHFIINEQLISAGLAKRKVLKS